MEPYYTKAQVLGYLNNQECDLTFEKVDGSVRHMRATRNVDMIDEQFHPKNASQDESNFIRVFDLEKKAWRGFQLDRLISLISE
jgi:hypothetical protein